MANADTFEIWKLLGGFIGPDSRVVLANRKKLAEALAKAFDSGELTTEARDLKSGGSQ